mgnify:CR=1 FL=1
MNTARIPDIFPERGRYLYMVSVWLHRRRGVGHWMRMEQRAPPAERNELISHIDQSFVTESCWRMRMLCVSCEFVYTVPSIAMLAEMLLPLSVCISIVLPS